MKSVKLGPYTIPIQRKELVNAAGCWDSDKRIITIVPGMEGAAYWDTLIHECVHAISDLHALGLCEAQVSSLGVGLAQALAPVIVED